LNGFFYDVFVKIFEIKANQIFSTTPNYSYLRASTGFLVAARKLCRLTDSREIINAMIPDNKNIHQLRSVLKAKF